MSEPNPSTPTGQKALIVGDLHLFASRSRGMPHWNELQTQLVEQQPDHCVFMGDIFDFPWARALGKERAITQAAEMVGALVAQFPGTPFHYLYGNHDQHPEFEALIEGYGGKSGNLTTHTIYHRIGNTVFMHGDAADTHDMDAATLVRRRRERTEKPLHGKLHESLYNLAIRLRIDELATSPAFFPNYIHRRLRSFIQRQGIENIEHVVYGHTHRKILNHTLDGVRFTNAGAPSGYRDYQNLIIRV